MPTADPYALEREWREQQEREARERQLPPPSSPVLPPPSAPAPPRDVARELDDAVRRAVDPYERGEKLHRERFEAPAPPERYVPSAREEQSIVREAAQLDAAEPVSARPPTPLPLSLVGPRLEYGGPRIVPPSLPYTSKDRAIPGIGVVRMTPPAPKQDLSWQDRLQDFLVTPMPSAFTVKPSKMPTPERRERLRDTSIKDHIAEYTKGIMAWGAKEAGRVAEDAALYDPYTALGYEFDGLPGRALRSLSWNVRRGPLYAGIGRTVGALSYLSFRTPDLVTPEVQEMARQDPVYSLHPAAATALAVDEHYGREESKRIVQTMMDAAWEDRGFTMIKNSARGDAMYDAILDGATLEDILSNPDFGPDWTAEFLGQGISDLAFWGILGVGGYFPEDAIVGLMKRPLKALDDVAGKVLMRIPALEAIAHNAERARQRFLLHADTDALQYLVRTEFRGTTAVERLERLMHGDKEFIAAIAPPRIAKILDGISQLYDPRATKAAGLDELFRAQGGISPEDTLIAIGDDKIDELVGFYQRSIAGARARDAGIPLTPERGFFGRMYSWGKQALKETWLYNPGMLTLQTADAYWRAAYFGRYAANIFDLPYFNKIGEAIGRSPIKEQMTERFAKLGFALPEELAEAVFSEATTRAGTREGLSAWGKIPVPVIGRPEAYGEGVLGIARTLFSEETLQKHPNLVEMFDPRHVTRASENVSYVGGRGVSIGNSLNLSAVMDHFGEYAFMSDFNVGLGLVGKYMDDNIPEMQARFMSDLIDRLPLGPAGGGLPGPVSEGATRALREALETGNIQGVPDIERIFSHFIEGRVPETSLGHFDYSDAFPRGNQALQDLAGELAELGKRWQKGTVIDEFEVRNVFGKYTGLKNILETEWLDEIGKAHIQEIIGDKYKHISSFEMVPWHYKGGGAAGRELPDFVGQIEQIYKPANKGQAANRYQGAVLDYYQKVRGMTQEQAQSYIKERLATIGSKNTTVKLWSEFSAFPDRQLLRIQYWNKRLQRIVEKGLGDQLPEWAMFRGEPRFVTPTDKGVEYLHDYWAMHRGNWPGGVEGMPHPVQVYGDEMGEWLVEQLEKKGVKLDDLDQFRNDKVRNMAQEITWPRLVQKAETVGSNVDEIAQALDRRLITEEQANELMRSAPTLEDLRKRLPGFGQKPPGAPDVGFEEAMGRLEGMEPWPEYEELFRSYDIRSPMGKPWDTYRLIEDIQRLPNRPAQWDEILGKGMPPGLPPQRFIPTMAESVWDQTRRDVDNMGRVLTEWEEQVNARLAGIAGEASILDAEAAHLGGVRDWAIKEYATLTDDIIREAINFRHSILFDFSLHGNLDAIVSEIIPFYKWPTRNIPFLAKFAAERPDFVALISRYMRISDTLVKLHNKPESWQGRLNLPVSKELARVLNIEDDDMWFDPSTIFTASAASQFGVPFELQDKWDEMNLLQKVAAGPRLVGMRYWPWWEAIGQHDRIGLFEKSMFPTSPITWLGRIVSNIVGTENVELDMLNAMEEQVYARTGAHIDIIPKASRNVVEDMYAHHKLADWLVNDEITMEQYQDALNDYDDPLFQKAYAETSTIRAKLALLRAFIPANFYTMSAQRGARRMIYKLNEPGIGAFIPTEPAAESTGTLDTLWQSESLKLRPKEERGGDWLAYMVESPDNYHEFLEAYPNLTREERDNWNTLYPNFEEVMEDLLPFYLPVSHETGGPHDMIRSRILSMAAKAGLPIPKEEQGLVFRGFENEEIWKSNSMWNYWWKTDAGQWRLSESMAVGSFSDHEELIAELEQGKMWDVRNSFTSVTNGMVDKWIEMRPGDTTGQYGLQAKRRAEWEAKALDIEYSNTIGAFSTRDEMTEWYLETIYNLARAQMPRIDDFTTVDEEGNPDHDWDAYDKAMEQFKEDLNAGDIEDASIFINGLAKNLNPPGHPEAPLEMGDAIELINFKGLESYLSRSNSILQAANDVWDENWYRPAMEEYETFRDLKGLASHAKFDPWEKKWGTVKAEQIADWILAAYGDKWTREEILEELMVTPFTVDKYGSMVPGSPRAMVWPSAPDKWLYKYRTGAEREATDDRSDAYDSYFNAALAGGFTADVTALWNEYHSIEDPAEQAAFIERYPVLADYSTWSRRWKIGHPDQAAIIDPDATQMMPRWRFEEVLNSIGGVGMYAPNNPVGQVYIMPAELRDHPLVQRFLDRDTKETVTPEEYAQLISMFDAWDLEHPDWPVVFDKYVEYLNVLDPALDKLEDEYYASGPKGGPERKAYLAAHPELKGYWDMKTALKQANPDMAVYFWGSVPETYVPYAPRTYGGWGGGGVGRRRDSGMSWGQIKSILGVTAIDALIAYWTGRGALNPNTTTYLQSVYQKYGMSAGTFDAWLSLLYNLWQRSLGQAGGGTGWYPPERESPIVIGPQTAGSYGRTPPSPRYLRRSWD